MEYPTHLQGHWCEIREPPDLSCTSPAGSVTTEFLWKFGIFSLFFFCSFLFFFFRFGGEGEKNKSAFILTCFKDRFAGTNVGELKLAD